MCNTAIKTQNIFQTCNAIYFKELSKHITIEKQRRNAGRDGEVKRESSYIEQLRIFDATTHPQGDVSNQHLSKDID